MVNTFMLNATEWMVHILGYVWAVRVLDFFEILTGVYFGYVISKFIHLKMCIRVIHVPKEKLYPAVATLLADGRSISVIIPENLLEALSADLAVRRIKLESALGIPLENRMTVKIADLKRTKRLFWITILLLFILASIGVSMAWNVPPPEWNFVSGYEGRVVICSMNWWSSTIAFS